MNKQQDDTPAKVIARTLNSQQVVYNQHDGELVGNAIIAALHAAGYNMVGWQLIETAPKDGSHVLLAVSVDPPTWVCEGYYEEDGDRGWFQANTHWTDAHDGKVFPSHWQPLPAPPHSRRAE